MRLLRITGADLGIFDFDLDLTWAAFFLSADGVVYGRYGGRDAKSADSRNTLEGLRFAMEAALETHKTRAGAKRTPADPVRIEDFAAARRYNGCIHCHQVKEIIRQEQKDKGVWQRDSVWVYPLPENIGLVLDKNRGNLVQAVAAQSPANQAGLKSGDVLRTIQGQPIHSFADAQYALHKAPLEGPIEVGWTQAGQDRKATLTLAKGWKKTNLTWRPSLLDILPSFTVFGYDLSAADKKKIGLGEKQLAFQQIAPVHEEAYAMGVREKDIILGLDDLKLEMSAEGFLAYVRQNFLVGDRLTLNLLRDGKKLDLRVKLK